MHPERQVSVSVDALGLHRQLSQFLRTALVEHIRNEPNLPFVVGYSGGSMPKTLIPVLKEVFESQHQTNVRFFPVDERLVPIDHSDNNSGVYLKQLTPPFKEDQFAIIPSGLLDDGEVAAEYLHNKLSEWSGSDGGEWPRINVLFLGMGPDGHTCSLFPQHPLLEEARKWIAPIENSPKPPPRRITITVPVVNAAQNVAFVVLGAEKADVLEKIIVHKSMEFPVGLIKLQNERAVHFFLDDKAASKVLNETYPSVKITSNST